MKLIPTIQNIELQTSLTDKKTFTIKELSMLESANIREALLKLRETKWFNEIKTISQMLDEKDRKAYLIEVHKTKPNFTENLLEDLSSIEGIKMVLMRVLKIDAIELDMLFNFENNSEKLVEIYNLALGIDEVKSEVNDVATIAEAVDVAKVDQPF